MNRNLLLAGSLTLLLGVSMSSICNRLLNNKKVETAGYISISVAKGIAGHVEYTCYKGGLQEVKAYPRMIGDTEHYLDFNGDNAVDRIRVEGSALKLNSLREILIRENDYPLHKEEFDDADKMMKEMSEKHRKVF